MTKYYYTSLITFFILFSAAIGFVLYQTKPSWVTKPNINGDKYDWYNLILLSLLGGLTLSLIILILYTPTNDSKPTIVKKEKPVTKTKKGNKKPDKKVEIKTYATEASSIF
jgi:hypothetical protein